MRTRLRNLVLGAVQRPRWQPLFARLRWLSLVGMNIGGGGDVESSGERHVLRRIRRCTGSRRLVVFDVGSNVGHYAQLALAELGPDTAVHCFEPSARTFPELQRNVSQFATIENFGFSDHPQTLPLFSHHERPGLSSPDSLGIYLTWGPRPGRMDSERNCISNVRPEGLSYQAAAHKLHFLVRQALLRQLSGVALKADYAN